MHSIYIYTCAVLNRMTGILAAPTGEHKIGENSAREAFPRFFMNSPVFINEPIRVMAASECAGDTFL